MIPISYHTVIALTSRHRSRSSLVRICNGVLGVSLLPLALLLSVSVLVADVVLLSMLSSRVRGLAMYRSASEYTQGDTPLTSISSTAANPYL
jgi:hypothetical protein